MKKSLTLFSVLLLALSLSFTLVACGGSDDNGEFQAKLENPLTEEEWRAAFDNFDNVTAESSVSDRSNNHTAEFTLKIYSDAYYVDYGGEFIYQGNAKDGYAAFDFSEHFSKFVFADGDYTLASEQGVTVTEGSADFICKTATVSFNKNKQIISVSYSFDLPEENDTLEYSFGFFNYGTTSENSSTTPRESSTVSERKWKKAFDLENVTVLVTSSVPYMYVENSTVKIYDSERYVSVDGVTFVETDLSEIGYANFDFSDQYSKFEYTYGEYRLKSGETAIVNPVRSIECKDMVVKFNDDSEVVYMSFTLLEPSEGGTVTEVFCKYEFIDYGETEAP